MSEATFSGYTRRQRRMHASQHAKNGQASAFTAVESLTKSHSIGRAKDDSKFLTSSTDMTTTSSTSSNNNYRSDVSRGKTKRKMFDSTAEEAVASKKRRESSIDINQDSAQPPKDIESKLIETSDPCPICLDVCTEPKLLNRCGHIFCRPCIDYYFETVKPQCPCCLTIYGEIRGNQPLNGRMTINRTHHRLPGFEFNSIGTIRITYVFPDGIQDESHPNPGQPYYGATRHAYLPDNYEGSEILKLLHRAFQLRQIFTIGQSRTTGYDNVITWNDIHHKTSYHGGTENFGYPDPTYLNRVRQELASKGII